MSKKVKPDFTVTSEMRDEFLARLTKRGVVVDRKDWYAGAKYVDRLLDGKIATLGWGDSTAKRRDLHDDPQLQRALDLLRRGKNTKDLLALAASSTPAPAAGRPKQH